MGDVIHVPFGTEREWKDTLRKTEDGLVTIGSLFGDPEPLMRAKARAVCQMLRRIVEQVPTFPIAARIPEPLTQEQREFLTSALKEAALKGTEITMTHSVHVLMSSIYDLCTSKLHTCPPSIKTAPNRYLLIATALGHASAKAATYPNESLIKPSGVHFAATILADELSIQDPEFDRSVFLKTFYGALPTSADITESEPGTALQGGPNTSEQNPR
jgi:hypothetical protein